MSCTCLHNMANFGPLAAEISSLVWGTPENFNGFRVLAALLHGTLVVGVSQTRGVEQRAPRIFGRAAIDAHWPTIWLGCSVAQSVRNSGTKRTPQSVSLAHYVSDALLVFTVAKRRQCLRHNSSWQLPHLRVNFATCYTNKVGMLESLFLTS